MYIHYCKMGYRNSTSLGIGRDFESTISYPITRISLQCLQIQVPFSSLSSWQKTALLPLPLILERIKQGSRTGKRMKGHSVLLFDKWRRRPFRPIMREVNGPKRIDEAHLRGGLV